MKYVLSLYQDYISLVLAVIASRLPTEIVSLLLFIGNFTHVYNIFRAYTLPITLQFLPNLLHSLTNFMFSLFT